jgi:hypothetical protein
MKGSKATGDVDVPWLYSNCHEKMVSKMTQLIKTFMQMEKSSKYFVVVKITAWKKKPKAAKCRDHCAMSLIAHKER